MMSFLRMFYHIFCLFHMSDIIYERYLRQNVALIAVTLTASVTLTNFTLRAVASYKVTV